VPARLPRTRGVRLGDALTGEPLDEVFLDIFTPWQCVTAVAVMLVHGGDLHKLLRPRMAKTSMQITALGARACAIWPSR
jgi:tRNA A58 N-methylase Trm61